MDAVNSVYEFFLLFYMLFIVSNAQFFKKWWYILCSTNFSDVCILYQVKGV